MKLNKLSIGFIIATFFIFGILFNKIVLRTHVIKHTIEASESQTMMLEETMWTMNEVLDKMKFKKLNLKTQGLILMNLRAHGLEEKVDWRVIRAIYSLESGGHHLRNGKVHIVEETKGRQSVGIGKVLTKHGVYDYRGFDLLSEEGNIAASICIFHDKYKAAKGNLYEAVRRYNGAITGKYAKKTEHYAEQVFKIAYEEFGYNGNYSSN